MEIKRNVLLKNHTTFKIGGPAEYFVKVKNKEGLVKAVKWARQRGLPFFILGGGSNILIPDRGYKGLAISFQFTIFNFQKNRMVAEGGTKLEDIVRASAECGLSGLEWAAGIPGTVGGAIFGNAAAFGKSMADAVESVAALDTRGSSFNITDLTRSQCEFFEKDSVFKKNKNLIILSAVLNLKKGDKRKIKKLIKENLNYRKEHPRLPSAGCIFKNVKLRTKNEKLPAGIRKFEEYKIFKKNKLIPAAFLIDRCGLKGKKIGKAQISEKHANFIVNLGGAKASEVKKLISLAKKTVKEKFNLDLKEEIQVY